jgi:hypothetical protein
MVDATGLRMQVEAARTTRLSMHQETIADGVSRLVEDARKAALREDPVPRRFWNWWRGTLVEAAYLNLHMAKAQVVELYEIDELRAEIPPAVARAQATLHRDDPRRVAAEQILQDQNVPPERIRPVLRRLIGDSYEKTDLEHAQLRSFRNIVLIAAFLMFVFVVATATVIAYHPRWLPLCFTSDGGQVCPTSTGAGPRSADIIMVALLGALGGLLTAALSIRNLKGTSTPYDVPVALAMLKVPLGAFTAILALVAIQGGFVPGLSNLDSQEQILAYALVFGFAQQALSRLLDQRAQTLMEGLPGGTATEPAPAATPAAALPATETAETAGAGETGETPALGTGEAGTEHVPGGELPADVAVLPTPEEEVEADVEGEPTQTPEETARPELLPDEADAEYVEDGLAEEPAGPEAPDGVEYPTAQEVKG